MVSVVELYITFYRLLGGGGGGGKLKVEVGKTSGHPTLSTKHWCVYALNRINLVQWQDEMFGILLTMGLCFC